MPQRRPHGDSARRAGGDGDVMVAAGAGCDFATLRLDFAFWPERSPRVRPLAGRTAKPRTLPFGLVTAPAAA